MWGVGRRETRGRGNKNIKPHEMVSNILNHQKQCILCHIEIIPEIVCSRVVPVMSDTSLQQVTDVNVFLHHTVNLRCTSNFLPRYSPVLCSGEGRLGGGGEFI